MTSLKGKDILRGNQFSTRDINGLIRIASNFEKELKKKDPLTLLEGKKREVGQGGKGRNT